MSLLLLPLFLILQLFTSIVWSQGTTTPTSTSPDPSSVTSTVITTAATQSGTTANSTSSASSTITASFPSLSGVSTCVSNCLAQGASETNCTSLVDVNCFCPNATYPSLLVDCVLSSCSGQIATIESLGQQFCKIASTTLSFPSISTTSSALSTFSSSSSSSTLTLTSTSTAASASTSPTSAASSWKSVTISNSLMDLGVVMLLGIVLGA